MGVAWAAATDTTQAPKRIATRKSTVAVRVSSRTRGAHSGPASLSGPPKQSGPTPDRYREIQETLISKGYLQQGSASGVWDQNSMDAMRKYQADQKMDPTGKITAKALINLGLGPKDESAPTTSK
jgi:hypothetical protein